MAQRLKHLKIWLKLLIHRSRELSEHQIRYRKYTYRMTQGTFSSVQFNSVQFSLLIVSDSLWCDGLQHARPPCPSPNPGICWNLCPLSQWCHPIISSSVIPFAPTLNLFIIRVFSNDLVLHITWSKYWSFSFSISPSNEHPELISFRIGWTGWISLQSKGLSRVFSNTTVQKHQFFGTQLSL